MDSEPFSMPKLSLLSLPSPSRSPEPPGTQTPPIRTPASIPFQWEEAPGKPRACTTLAKASSAKCLELSPRLLSEIKFTNIPSPTTVLDGPYVGRSFSSSFRFRNRQRSFGGGGLDLERRQIGDIVNSREQQKERGGGGGGGGGGGWFFDSWRRKTKGSSLKLNGEFGGGSSSNLVLSSYVFAGAVINAEDDSPKVKITKITRNGSFLNLSHTRSHLWANLYESFKQVVPWRRSRKWTNGDLVE